MIREKWILQDNSIILPIKMKMTPSSLTKCLICKKNYLNPGHLRRHQQSVHLGVKEFQCFTCDTSYVDERSLRWHNFKSHLG
jgi:uncharacterized Zn-finger protein